MISTAFGLLQAMTSKKSLETIFEEPATGAATLNARVPQETQKTSRVRSRGRPDLAVSLKSFDKT